MEPENKGKQALGAMTVQWTPADAVSFKSISAVQKNDTHFQFDVFNAALRDPFAVIPFVSDQRSKSFSQELTSNLKLFDDRLSVVLGAFYFRETFKGDNDFNFFGFAGAGIPPVVPLAGFVEKTNSRALFMDGTLRLSDRFRILFGARGTWEKKKIDQRLDQSGLCANPNFDLKYRDFSPKLGVQYSFSPDVMTYFVYQKGFKAGGFGAYVCQNLFGPEKITSYEGGVKGQFLDHALTLSASAFHYDYNDLQVLFQIGSTNRIDNAATSKIDGGEVEFTLRPAGAFQIDGKVSILDARYTRFITDDPLGLYSGPVDLSGNRLLRAPRFTARLGVQNRMDVGIGELLLRAEMQHVSKVYFAAFNRPGEAQPAVDLFNAYANLKISDGWSLRAFVKNLTDRTVINNASIVSVTASVTAGADPANPNFPAAIGYAAPRTWGVGIGKEF